MFVACGLLISKAEACIMAKVQVTNVTVLDNPSSFLNPFQFQITFESIEDLQDGKHLVANEFSCFCLISRQEYAIRFCTCCKIFSPDENREMIVVAIATGVPN